MNIWVSGCSHVPTDLRNGPRESLAGPIRQSEGRSEGDPAFDWDFGIMLGDFCGALEAPEDWEGEQVIAQFAALQDHRREAIYTLAGNHDASPHTQPEMWWFRKWIDPVGESTTSSGVSRDRMPYPVSGTWERYHFEVGNVLFLMMSDLNNLPPPIGRGARGGYPAGAVSGDTFSWWQEMVAMHTDKIIVSCHHHMLKETTVASGKSEASWRDADGAIHKRFHGYREDGAPEGASYLYFVAEQPDAQAFERHLAQHPGATDLWLGGHTHTNPDMVVSGRSHIETKWGAHFINAAGLTLHHGKCSESPMSRLLTFTEGSNKLRIQCYLHTDHHAPVGFYQPAERTLELSKPFTGIDDS